MSRAHTVETFVDAATRIHGSTYDYSLTRWSGGNKIPIEIGCREHGAFSQRPNDHLTGYGCPRCGDKRNWDSRRPITWDSFLADARRVHGDRYSYTKINLNRVGQKIAIHCKEHGEFLQDATHHIGRSQGCRLCCFMERNMDSYQPIKREEWMAKWGGEWVTFYIVESNEPDESFIKIGITGRTIKDRFSREKKAYVWTIVRSHIAEAGSMFDLELEIKRRCSALRHQPKRRFAGHTECFKKEALSIVIEMLENS